uniref:Truncated viral movement protein n=1 Tax=Temperate fruit decay-associated virus TaxID=1628899 RepID=A0A0R8K6W7_9VIRU|nr:truncated viral movement protein [Temperate fruit decay-associated virus]
MDHLDLKFNIPKNILFCKIIPYWVLILLIVILFLGLWHLLLELAYFIYLGYSSLRRLVSRFAQSKRERQRISDLVIR